MKRPWTYTYFLNDLKWVWIKTVIWSSFIRICFHERFTDSNEPQPVFFVVEPTLIITAKRKELSSFNPSKVDVLLSCSLSCFHILRSILWRLNSKRSIFQIHNTRDKKGKYYMMKRTRTYSSFAAYNCASSFGMLHKKNRYGSSDKRVDQKEVGTIVAILKTYL